jgi:ATP diphosphatase
VLLASANAKFVQRFDAMEDRLSAEGRSLEAASADEMEAAWEAVKSAGSA